MTKLFFGDLHKIILKIADLLCKMYKIILLVKMHKRSKEKADLFVQVYKILIFTVQIAQKFLFNFVQNPTSILIF